MTEPNKIVEVTARDNRGNIQSVVSWSHPNDVTKRAIELAEKRLNDRCDNIVNKLKSYIDKSLFTLIDELGERYKAGVEHSNKLLARIKSLEARLDALGEAKYVGVWKSSVDYRRGNFVTARGSVWHADQPSSGVEPGSEAGRGFWTLAVKSGGR